MDADINRVRRPSKSFEIRPFGIHFHASVKQYQHLLSNPEKLCSLDFHFKEVKNRFKKLGL